jgi:hypothetical protein
MAAKGWNMNWRPLMVLLVAFSFVAGGGAAQGGESIPTGLATDPEPVENSPLATEGPKPHPIAPRSQEDLRKAIVGGVEFLLADQRPDGRWGSAEDTKDLNIYAPVPGAHHGFRYAVTGLAVEALVLAEPRLEGDLRDRVGKAIDRAEAWMLVNGDIIRRAETDAIYNNWGHSYGIHGLVALYHRAEGDSQRQETLRKAAQVQADKLAQYAYLNGGWGYYDFDFVTQIPAGSPNSFTTATGLVALDLAKEIGVTFPDKLTVKAIESIKRQRQPDFTYAYGEYLRMTPARLINRAGGSLGRSQACNLALRLYGDRRVTNEVIKTWLDRLYARNGWLEIGRKRPIPHESHFQVAGYFYYYGHYYAALSFELLPQEERQHFQDHMAYIIIPQQEKDGSWFDYPFYNYHRQYGTAMAVTTLLLCEHDNQVELFARHP